MVELLRDVRYPKSGSQSPVFRYYVCEIALHAQRLGINPGIRATLKPEAAPNFLVQAVTSYTNYLRFLSSWSKATSTRCWGFILPLSVKRQPRVPGLPLLRTVQSILGGQLEMS